MTQVFPTGSRIFKFIREAVMGDTHRDFTEERIGRAIAMLAIPMVLEMMMESLFAVVDMFWVAHLGPNSVATVGFTEALLTLIYTVALGLSIATAATVARRIGEKDPQAASETAAQAILLGGGAALVIGVSGAVFAPQLLTLMGASRDVVATGSGYARAIFGGSGAVLLLFLINAVFRGAGDAALAMRVLWTANLINIVLNPLLIFGIGPFPRLGVAGSGIGTTIGRSTGVLLQLWMLTNSRSRVVVHAREFHFRPKLMWNLLRLSLGGMLQYFVGTSSWILLIRMTAPFGSVVIAGYTIMLRIIMFALLPSWGMASAAATLVGQNLGAKKPDRAESAVWRAGFYNMVLLGLVAIVFVAFAPQLVHIFTDDAAVSRVASNALRIISAGYIFYAWGMVVIQSFNGAGDTVTPTLINLFCFWACQLPIAWWLAFHSPMASNGIFAAIAVSQSLIAVIGMIAFRRGTWKLKKI
ncbi:MAG TPA: MATE family efflux transporter [Bryobacteraceae bacterium]|nr:MATE family efflux transporter [Bryobacteraceae bacterium]